MIIVESVAEHPGLVKRYSNMGFMIRQDQTGFEYSEAIDIEDAPYTYTETDIPIYDDEEITDTEALNIIMGREQQNEQA